MKPYLYTLPEAFNFSHPLFLNMSYKNEWIEVDNGLLSISPNYSWDGCTPKWQPLGLFTFGTPDGALRFGKPWLYYPSLVHDVLCQFRAELPFTQVQVTEIFTNHLEQVQWPLTSLYRWGVNTFGPQDFN